MKLNSFLSTLYEKVTPSTKDLTVNFVGRFVDTVFERTANSETVKHYTLTFGKIDHRTLSLSLNCQVEYSHNGKATAVRNIVCNFANIRCWADTFIKFEETVIDSMGIESKITGTGIFFPYNRSVRIGVKIASNREVQYLSLNMVQA